MGVFLTADPAAQKFASVLHYRSGRPLTAWQFYTPLSWAFSSLLSR
jgi:hypothetical protein